MATQTTEQQNALKDAMARAKEIAARLQQSNPINNNSNSDNDINNDDEEVNAPSCNDKEEPESGKRKSLLGMEGEPEAKRIANSSPSASELENKSVGPMLVSEITLPNSIMGLVMGKGGSMINKLQAASSTKLQVSTEDMCPTPDHRLVTITGNAEAVAKAKELLEEIHTTGKVPDQLLLDPNEFNSEMTIPREKAGLVIGRGGEMIKSLMHRAGCKIVLIQDGAYEDSPEKLLRFSGDQEACMHGKQLVQDLLAGNLSPANSMLPQGGEEYMEINVPRESIGMIIGTRGSNIQQLQHETGCKVQFQKEMQGDFKVCMLSGTPEQVQTASSRINEMIETGNNPFEQYPSAMGGPRPRWGGPRMRPPYGPRGFPNWGPPGSGPRPPMHRGPGPRTPFNHMDLYIEVPSNKCGIVIGKGGDTIKQIKSESQANIQLDRNTPDTSPFKVFRMSGSDEAVEIAVQMVRDIIEDQSLTPKSESRDGPPGQGANQWGCQDQWGNQNQGNWFPPQGNQQWSDQWNQHQSWGGQQQQQQSGWNTTQQSGNQGWNQQQSWDQQSQQSYGQQPQQQDSSSQADQQGQSWQAPSNTTSGQWPNQQQQQQQWGQSSGATSSAQTSQAASQQAYQQTVSSTGSTTKASVDSTGQTGTQSQQDYSAAWALYYQQQQQYYQQYYAQQAQAAAAAAAVSASTSTVSSAVSTTNNSQANSTTQFQAHYAQYGQQQQSQ